MEKIEYNYYYGKICQSLNITQLDIHQTAIVKEPVDKRFIIQEFQSEDGPTHDYMIMLRTNEKPNDSEINTTARIVYNTLSIDIF